MLKKFIFLLMLTFTQSCFATDAFSIYLVRHAQKQLDMGSNPELTRKGRQTANDLAALLANTNLQDIYSTDYLRTQQTAAPLAKVLGQQVKSYDPSQLAKFAQQVLMEKRDILIVGHSNTTPDLIRALGGKGQAIDESRYGDLYQLVFVIDDTKAKPQLVKQTQLTIPGAP